MNPTSPSSWHKKSSKSSIQSVSWPLRCHNLWSNRNKEWSLGTEGKVNELLIFSAMFSALNSVHLSSYESNLSADASILFLKLVLQGYHISIIEQADSFTIDQTLIVYFCGSRKHENWTGLLWFVPLTFFPK